MIWFGEEAGLLLFGYFRVAVFDESGVELPDDGGVIKVRIWTQ
ncbi:MAG: hypothetical protein U9N40_06715 [Euryarchaeota archaeon]|nr:hypothetical protein [Euryarchaeota archaeon]